MQQKRNRESHQKKEEHTCARKQEKLDAVQKSARSAHGEEVFMKIKKLFGICERKGCKNFACRLITVYDNKKHKVIELQLCEDCTFDIYKNGIEIMGEKKDEH